MNFLLRCRLVKTQEDEITQVEEDSEQVEQDDTREEFEDMDDKA